MAISSSRPTKLRVPEGRSGLSSRKILTIIASVAIACILLFVCVLNPSTSLLSSIHDADGDGVADANDAFPNDATEWSDTDDDGYGDNSDAFPNDAKEWNDTDGDGYGDNSDKFPNNSSEWNDTDDDGYGDNSDAFPNDAKEWNDTDGDGHGDNSDKFPNDPARWTPNTPEDAVRAFVAANNAGDSYLFLLTTVARYYTPSQFAYLNDSLSLLVGIDIWTITAIANITYDASTQSMMSQRIISLESGTGIDVEDSKGINVTYTYTDHWGSYVVSKMFPCLKIDNWWYIDMDFNCLYSASTPDGRADYIAQSNLGMNKASTSTDTIFTLIAIFPSASILKSGIYVQVRNASSYLTIDNVLLLVADGTMGFSYLPAGSTPYLSVGDVFQLDKAWYAAGSTVKLVSAGGAWEYCTLFV